MSISQHNRLIQISAGFVREDTIVTDLQGTETFSEPFTFHVSILSDNHNLASKDVIGQKCTVTLSSQDNLPSRAFNGRVMGMSLGGLEGDRRRYVLRLVPGFWFTNHTRRQRIFENLKVTDIIKKILDGYGDFCPIEDRTTASYLAREYCVQYGETDFDFLSRLMAEEGIGYYFVHKPDRHIMVLCDSTSGYTDCDELKVRLAVGSDHDPDARIVSWQRELQYHANSVETLDYNHKTPKNFYKQNVATCHSFAQKPAESTLQTFGGFNFTLKSAPDHDLEVATNSQLTKVRMESLEAAHDVAQGSGYCESFFPGGRFNLEHHIASEANGYVLTQVNHMATNSNSNSASYHNQFTCIPDRVVFRPPQKALKKRMSGPLTGTVTQLNASESKAEADPHRMVRVTFPWADGNNSCWLRVAQLYAGAGWGASFVPRLQQEVLVDFLDGDPDRPVVIGALYNKDNQGPAYTSTQSGIKTASNKFNELRFDDKSGEEEIYVEAGKNYNFLIHNDETGKILNNQTLTVQQNRTLTISEGDETKELKQGNQTLKVAGNQKNEIKGDQNTQISGNQALKVQGNQKTEVTGNQEAKVTGNHKSAVTGTISLDSKQSITLQANISIELKVGGNSIKIDPSGITITGTMVKINGNAMTEVKGGGMLKMQGGLVMIN